MKKMTCNEFNDILWDEGFYSEMHSEMFHSDSFDSEKILKAFESEAQKRGIKLIDENDWDYDKVFWNNYKSDDDKGLS